ncbi:hypothetical protein V6N11_074329 [Hibiscus sabdariffa]|uniref:Uncharacterized protein n=1 Tax=Hibiscus sabdariffa TaxID=183260 RepID=A0ABR2R3M9_9ROSI
MELKIMGKASRWLRTVFCLKRPDSHHQPPPSKPPHKDRRRWISLCCVMPSSSSVKAPALTAQANHHRQQKDSGVGVVDPNKQAISSAVKAPALPAQAAAKVVKLTSNSVSCGPEPVHNFSRSPTLKDIAAVIIQSAYRGHLARNALRALKGVVKFQALVRGHIERKRAAEWLRRMEILVRAQIRARDERFRITPSSNDDHIVQVVDSTIKGRNPFRSSYLPLHSYLSHANGVGLVTRFDGKSDNIIDIAGINETSPPRTADGEPAAAFTPALEVPSFAVSISNRQNSLLRGVVKISAIIVIALTEIYICN